jgi:hypothetical protein
MLCCTMPRRGECTLEEVARELGLSYRTGYDQVAGGLVVTETGKRLNIVSRDQIERYRRDSQGRYQPEGVCA